MPFPKRSYWANALKRHLSDTGSVYPTLQKGI